MARQKKDSEAMSLLLEKSLAEKLKEFCQRNRMTKTAAIELALQRLFDSEEQGE